MVKYIDLVSDTICSQITPPGYSGVSVIRVSGPRSVENLRILCPNLPETLQSHSAYLSPLIDSSSKKSLDSVLVTYFQQGRSFTGDEVVEISCHGNPLIVQNIIHQLLHLDCRLAERGEFSFRAFYNGKIDLVQAESINALIHSGNAQSSSVALGQLGGDLSSSYRDMEKKFLVILGQLEASIDFTEQDIDPESYRTSLERSGLLLAEVEGFLASYDIGKNLMERWNIVLAGETNVGKSSLFNALFNKNMAIVSNQPGTTRDLVSKDSFLENYSVQFVDSAGLRQHADLIEQLGIEKTKEAISEASILLWVCDISRVIPWEAIRENSHCPLILVANKVDLLSDLEVVAINSAIQKEAKDIPVCFVSAQQGDGVFELKSFISDVLGRLNTIDNPNVVTQARHFDLLVKIKEHILAGRDLLKLSESPDLISQEFQWGLQELNALLGKTYDDEILDTIFSEFCLGK